MVDILDPVVVLKVRGDATKKLAIRIGWQQMTKSLISQWAEHVQPVVNENYRTYGDESNTRQVRADVGWDWFECFRYAGLHNVISKNKHRAVAVCAVIETTAGFFPVGMLTAVPCLMCSVDEEKRSRGFAWYLADAPVETYAALGIHPASQVAAVLLDSAIQLSRSLGGDGTLLLHADPSGGDRLQKFYIGAGMRQLDAGGTAVTYLRRKHKTEEYFVFSPTAAAEFCRRFDAQRASALPT